eukprot:TRINITY_DN35675_c0_g1_i1.p1 TRINITY_DN35675_c0_g1~~TRINITY_DN35675_c0_g1_i1.p1  ORF type:complete len:151 (-),score=26.78 TRINITY_DN35675_c0_g1_i1:5-391(-)
MKCAYKDRDNTWKTDGCKILNETSSRLSCHCERGDTFMGLHSLLSATSSGSSGGRSGLLSGGGDPCATNAIVDEVPTETLQLTIIIATVVAVGAALLIIVAAVFIMRRRQQNRRRILVGVQKHANESW